MTVDIVFGDKLKQELRLILWYLRRKLKNEYKITSEAMHDDMVNCGNPVVAEVYRLILDAADQIEEEYQKSVSVDIPEIGLWIVYRDTAYLPIFMYILKNLMDKKDELMPIIMQYYTEPKDWYVNQWHKSKMITQRLKDEQKLSGLSGDLGFSESVFVPPIQAKRVAELTKDIDKEVNLEKKKRGV